MPLGILGKLGAVGSGLQDAIPKLIENDEKELNAEFMSNFHRISVSEDPMQLQQLMQDPRFSRVTPEVRQRAMQIAERVLARKATAADRDRAHRLNVEKMIADRQAQIHKLGAEGYDVAHTPSDEFGLPQITDITPGERRKRLQEAEAIQAESVAGQKALDLKKNLEAYDNRRDKLQRAIFAATKNPGLIKDLDDDIRQDVLLTLSEQGISTTAVKSMPLAFMLRMAELRSALGELNDLQERLVAGRGGQGPLAGWFAKIPGTDSRSLRAHINRVKQRIGKALEGGVLRKEDEEKYKKILPTIFDTESVSDAKYEGLVAALTRDMNTLQSTFDEYGGRINTDDPNVALALMEQLQRTQGLSFGTARGMSFIDRYQQR